MRGDVPALFCPFQDGSSSQSPDSCVLSGSLLKNRALESSPFLFLTSSSAWDTCFLWFSRFTSPPSFQGPRGPLPSPFTHRLTQPLLLWDNSDTNTGHSLCARPCPSYFTGINSLNLQTTLWDGHSPLYKGGDAGSERLTRPRPQS